MGGYVPTHGPDCETRNYKTRCSHCGEAVFFFSCSCGSAVFFDGLGHPWHEHDCTWGERHYADLRGRGHSAQAAMFQVLTDASHHGRSIPDHVSESMERDTKVEKTRRSSLRSPRRTLYREILPDQPREFPGRVIVTRAPKGGEPGRSPKVEWGRHSAHAGSWASRMEDDRRLITRVVLRNYRSIAACDVSPAQLTFIVGPNGSGKGNFLDALRFVADSVRHSLDHALRNRGGIREVRRRYSGHPAHVGVRVEFDLGDATGHFAFTVVAKRGGGYGVKEEECVVLPKDDAPAHYYRASSGRSRAAFRPYPRLRRTASCL